MSRELTTETLYLSVILYLLRISRADAIIKELETWTRHYTPIPHTKLQVTLPT